MQTLSLFEKYKTNIDEVGGKRRYSWRNIGVEMTLKVRITPMETTKRERNNPMETTAGICP